jgi:hypothetical protein
MGAYILAGSRIATATIPLGFRTGNRGVSAVIIAFSGNTNRFQRKAVDHKRQAEYHENQLLHVVFAANNCCAV